MAGREELELIYEDDWILVVNKPSGLLTMSTGRGAEETAYRILTDYIRSKKPCRGHDRRSGSNSRIFIVHRLDRDTSGLLIFAKTEEMKYALQDDWNDSILERKYIALVEGVPQKAEGTVVSWLKDNPKSMIVSSCPFDNGGKKAVTHYRVISPAPGPDGNGPDKEGTAFERGAAPQYAMVEFSLETGRKNQIRVHAADIGHPVAGDRKYGAKTNPIGRLALHAKTVSFRHPATGKVLRFDTGTPKTFRKAYSVQQRTGTGRNGGNKQVAQKHYK